jgi:metallo-beta-lactamase family protein
MLVDSAHIQTDDAAFVSKKRARQKMPPVEPLYSMADAEKAVRQFVAANYDQPFEPVDGVTVTFRDAGHILGSAQVVLDIREGGPAAPKPGGGGRKFRWLFSGDIGRGGDEILRDPEPVENVDYLQIESTYGGREHAVRKDADEIVCRLVSEALQKKGKVIIPSFSVGRTQQIVYVLHQLTLSGCLPRVPIFVDSPLSVNATEIYRKHTECFNENISRFLRENANPFGMENLTYIREAEESKKLNDLKEPVVIISASGMCEAGRIRHHLKNNLGDAKNLILFIGYCAEYTLGAQILAGKSPVNIFGEPHEVRAKIASLDTYSGHADRNELKRYVEKISGDLKKICCIHGEESQCLAHAETLRTLKPKAEILVPEYKQTLSI